MTPNAFSNTRGIVLPRLLAMFFCGLALPGFAQAAAVPDGTDPVVEYVAAWRDFYPSRAFAYGDRDSAAAFEDFSDTRVDAWLALNERIAQTAKGMLAAPELDLQARTDLQVLQARAVDELATWAEDQPRERQAPWYAEKVSQAMTHLLVREQLSPAERHDAALVRLAGVARLCELGVARIDGGNALRTGRALRTLAATRAFYERDLGALLAPWRDDEAAGRRASEAIAAAVAAIRALEVHLEALLPRLSQDPSIGADVYAAKLARRSGASLTPDRLRRDSREEMQRVRALMVEEARRWQREAASVAGDADGEALLRLALEAMEADREANSADFLAQYSALTEAAERFVIDHDIATVPQPTTLFVALSPAHFSGAAVGGVYPSGPFDPSADTLFYLPFVPDDAPAAAREGFYRSFNDHFNAAIIAHEMFPGHYLQYKVAVSAAPPVRSLFSNGAYTEGWGSFVEELMLDAGWAGNAPLTRLAHLRKRLENATRAHVSVQVHTAGWGQDEVLSFARDEGLLAPQFAENLWQRVVNSPLQITDYFVGYRIFHALYEQWRAATDATSPQPWVDAVLRAGPVPMALLPPLLED